MASRNKTNKKVVDEDEFNPEDYEDTGLSIDEIVEFKEVFDLFDKDKSGSIDPKELKDVLESLGFEAKSQTVYQMIESLDVDRDGKIEFNEFLALMTAKKSEQQSRPYLQKMFNIFKDDPKSEFITMKGLRKIAKELGETADDDALENMIAKGDHGAKGHVSFEDFYSLLSKRTF